MTDAIMPRGTLASQTVQQAGRLLTRWRREPEVLVQALLFPTFLLVVYKLVIGQSILTLTGSNSLYGLVPMAAVTGALFGALGTGVAIPAERESGLLSRLWVLPVHRASALTGRLLAEATRTLIGAVLMTVVGLAMGLRFGHGAEPVSLLTSAEHAVAFVLVPVVVIIGFAAVVVALAVRSVGRNMVTGLASVCFLLLFFNTGMVPVAVFPGWLQAIVRAQPMSPAIETMRAIAEGGPTLVPFLQTLAWTAGLLAVFGPLAIRGYRAAAEAGH
jgi:ABC-2 type transport system permease protein